jgi:hypothetical protein
MDRRGRPLAAAEQHVEALLMRFIAAFWWWLVEVGVDFMRYHTRQARQARQHRRGGRRGEITKEDR